MKLLNVYPPTDVTMNLAVSCTYLNYKKIQEQLHKNWCVPTPIIVIKLDHANPSNSMQMRPTSMRVSNLSQSRTTTHYEHCCMCALPKPRHKTHPRSFHFSLTGASIAVQTTYIDPGDDNSNLEYIKYVNKASFYAFFKTTKISLHSRFRFPWIETYLW